MSFLITIELNIESIGVFKNYLEVKKGYPILKRISVKIEKITSNNEEKNISALHRK